MSAPDSPPFYDTKGSDSRSSNHSILWNLQVQLQEKSDFEKKTWQWALKSFLHTNHNLQKIKLHINTFIHIAI